MPKSGGSGSGSGGYAPYSRSGVYTASGAPVRNPAAYAATGARTYTGGGRPITSPAAYSNAVSASRAGGSGTKVYHGTSNSAAAAIMDSGFRPSSDGLLGAGVYVTTDRSKAVSFAQSHGDDGRAHTGIPTRAPYMAPPPASLALPLRGARSNPTLAGVIVGRAQFGKTASVDATDARKGKYSETSWQSSHDTAYVPRGEGVARPEHCVQDPARIKPLYSTVVSKYDL